LTIKNAVAYQSALSAKESASTELLNIQSNPASAANSHETTHPLFVSQASVLGLDAKKMQSYFLAFSAVSFEALTAIVWLVVGLLGTRNVYEGDYAYEETTRNRLGDDKANGLGQSLGNDKKPAKMESKQSLHETIAHAREENNDLGKL